MISDRRRLIVFFAMFLLLHSAQPVIAQRDQDLEYLLGLDLGSFASGPSLLVLGVAAIGTAWSWEESDENFPRLQESLDGGILDVPADWGNVFGSGWIIGGSGIALYSAGRLGDQRQVSEAGSDLLRSFAYSSLVTGILKHSIDRKRPSGGSLSFPSGHTTAAFSTVPIAWHHGDWKVGVPICFLATMTALGRMEENRHYLSDVIAGAAIGTMVGMAVVSRRAHENQGWQMHAGPRSLAVTWRF